MWLSLPEYCNSATLDAATGISYVTPSRNCNSATLDQAANSSGSGSSFTIFGIGSPRTIPRRPTSTGLQVDEVTPVGCARHPATCGALLSRRSLRREFAGRRLIRLERGADFDRWCRDTMPDEVVPPIRLDARWPRLTILARTRPQPRRRSGRALLNDAKTNRRTPG
jgi:hypothetical protein